MIQIISGEKGKGKTKILLDKVNASVESAKGTIVYLDKNVKHMYELNNKVRLINVKDFCVETTDEFVGFICGIISQDHDLEKMYLDSFMNIAFLEGKDITATIQKLDLISTKFNVDLILSVSLNSNLIPEAIKDKVIVAL